MEFPRVLIVSNDCLSKSSSNGRTLRNFLTGWPREALAQFYLQSGEPEFETCANYYRVTDGQALRAFLGKGHGGGVVTEEPNSKPMETAAATGGKGIGRTALTMLVRELVWNSRRWMTEDFRRWTAKFAPQVILLQAGDCGFMLRLAEDLSRQFNAPLVIFNSEGYYFKDFDYFRASGPAHWAYPLFRRQFCRTFRQTMARAKHCVYSCEPLEKAYEREFTTPSETIYTATEMVRREAKPESSGFRASYLGNLGLRRHEVLVEIATALQELSPELYLDVYGRIPDETARRALENCAGIRCRGFVSYDEVTRVMAESDLLVHGESFDPFYREDLKFAFSTKIADSLASGTCFLLYAPENLACTEYLWENRAAWVVSDPKALKPTLRTLVEQPEERSRYLGAAAALVERNHSAGPNADRFRRILQQAAEAGGQN